MAQLTALAEHFARTVISVAEMAASIKIAHCSDVYNDPHMQCAYETYKATAGNRESSWDKNTGRHMIASRAQIKEIDISQPANVLRFLRFTDYAFVILCSCWPLWITFIGFAVSADTVTRITILLIYLTILFALYTAWRNMGVIRPQRWPLYFVFSLVFSMFSFSSVQYLLKSDVPSLIIDPKPIISATVFTCLTLIYFCGFISALLLKKVRIESIGMPLVELLYRLRSYRPLRSAGAARTRKIATPVGIAVGTFGFFLLLVGPIIGVALYRIGPAPFVIWFPFILMGWFFLLSARRYLQTEAGSLLSTDKRNAILFLRSFYDDQKQRVANAPKAIVDFSLEVRLAKHFNYFAPFIAVGSPMETVPQLGAAIRRSEDSVADPKRLAQEWSAWRMRSRIPFGVHLSQCCIIAMIFELCYLIAMARW